MSECSKKTLVNAEWLATNLGTPRICVVDGSWHLPTLGRDPRTEFAGQHIPGAVFFDIDQISDDENPLPHMVPSEEQFATEVGALGIRNEDHIIAYDATGVGSVARVWWMFRLFGHRRVSVLDGGLPAWVESGGPLENCTGAPNTTKYAARLNPNLLRKLEDLLGNIENNTELVLDARTPGRYAGTEPEPRPGLRGGHIPKSLNLPFLDLYDVDTHLMKSGKQLRKVFSKAGVEDGKSVVASCGSGITACNLALALHIIGRNDVAVYDGSWSEWGARKDTPVKQ